MHCTEMVGLCELVTMVLPTTLVTMPSACRGEMSARVLLSERGLTRNLATSTYMHECNIAYSNIIIHLVKALNMSHAS